MIATFVASLLIGQTDIKAAFDRSLAAHKALNNGSLTVETESVVAGRAQRATYELTYMRPSRLALRLRQDGSDRTYFFLDRQVYGFDRRNNEYLKRTLPAGLSLLEAVALLFKGLDDAVQTVIDTDVMFGLYQRLQSAPGWRRTNAGGLLSYSMTTGSKKDRTGMTVRFDARHLLRYVQILSPAARITWNYRYGTPPRSIAFRRPADAIEVESFLELGPEPQYTGNQAKAKVAECARAHDGLRHVELVTKTGTDSSHIWYSNHRLREKQASVDWSYGDGVLAIRDLRRKRLYRGQVSYASAPKYLQKLGVRMDPLIKQLITRRNPMRQLLDPNAKVRFVGSLAAGGVSHDLIEVALPAQKSTVWIRSQDKLIGRIETRHLDAKGSVVTTTLREIDYVRLGKPISAATFKYPGTAERLTQIGR